ncbi:uncharacterized protein LOC108027040 isoform X2 [Drosophila biarmipes]|uniref:uncharacterized protein LOC108027040 isoform X2 n=1 Tax=Drosophila biarmipes TaxID=125945 RepID=UPI0007E7A13C|nr:uncharacterized protein LOC108027040 isoform X2 [Drosophila biarmipes]
MYSVGIEVSHLLRIPNVSNGCPYRKETSTKGNKNCGPAVDGSNVHPPSLSCVNFCATLPGTGYWQLPRLQKTCPGPGPVTPEPKRPRIAAAANRVREYDTSCATEGASA